VAKNVALSDAVIQELDKMRKEGQSYSEVIQWLLRQTYLDREALIREATEEYFRTISNLVQCGTRFLIDRFVAFWENVMAPDVDEMRLLRDLAQDIGVLNSHAIMGHYKKEP